MGGGSAGAPVAETAGRDDLDGEGGPRIPEFGAISPSRAGTRAAPPPAVSAPFGAGLADPPRRDVVVLLGLASLAGGLVEAHPGPVLGASLAGASFALIGAAAGRRFGRGRVRLWPLAFALALLALGAWRARRAVAQHEARRAALDAAVPGRVRCDAEARVTSAPVLSGGTLRFVVELHPGVCDEKTVPFPFLAALHAPIAEASEVGGEEADGEAAARRAIVRGARFELVAELAPLERFSNVDLGDPVPSEVRRGVLRSGAVLALRAVAPGRGPLAWIDRARAHARARIEATFPASTAPMARALVLGENDLVPEEDAAFRESGLSHLLAVSGMHLVLVVLGVVRALRAALVRIERVAGRMDVAKITAPTGIALAWAYAEFAGASGSALRASWMLTAILLASLLGRRGDAVRALGASMLGMSAFDPLAAYDASFVLSVLATAGLVAFASPFASAIAKVPGVPALLARSAAATLGATVACAPYLALFAPTVPLGSVAANLLAVPVGELAALPLCLVHALVAFWPGLERGCALAASGGLSIVRAIATGFAGARWLSMPIAAPTAEQLGALAAAWGALSLLRGRRRLAAVAACVVLVGVCEIGVRRQRMPRGLLRVTFLDVGQGDAAIVDLPDGEAMVIDGGGLIGSPVDVGARVLAPSLRARRRDRVAAVVLSHPHPDHYGGLGTGLAGVRVAAFWDTGQGEREGVLGAYAALVTGMRDVGARVLGPRELCGRHAIGGAIVEVLAPCPDADPDRGANDNSFVLRISHGARSILFVGDAEHEAEELLLRRAATSLRSDVLKVGHHGSRTSTSPEFLRAVHPSDAVVSVGTRNRFGHPSPITLETLRRAGVCTWRTDDDGAVVVETDGERLSVRAVARSPTKNASDDPPQRAEGRLASPPCRNESRP